jgi:hypothetical protein
MMDKVKAGLILGAMVLFSVAAQAGLAIEPHSVSNLFF